MVDNGIDSVNFNLPIGSKIIIKQEPVDTIVAGYFEDNNLKVNSGFILEIGSYNSDFNLDFK
jgi:hypothetical protein